MEIGCQQFVVSSETGFWVVGLVGFLVGLVGFLVGLVGLFSRFGRSFSGSGTFGSGFSRRFGWFTWFGVAFGKA